MLKNEVPYFRRRVDNARIRQISDCGEVAVTIGEVAQQMKQTFIKTGGLIQVDPYNDDHSNYLLYLDFIKFVDTEAARTPSPVNIDERINIIRHEFDIWFHAPVSDALRYRMNKPCHLFYEN